VKRQTSKYLSSIPSQILPLESYAVHYLCMGEGHPLILVHGGGIWLYSFRHNITPLSCYFRVHALDMPGYGYTVPIGRPGPVGLDTLSDTLLQFMDRLGIQSATIVGHSWGGGWVIHFASCHPERVSGLVLIDSSGLDVRDVLEWELLKVPVLGPVILRCLTVRTVMRHLAYGFHLPGMVTRDMAVEVHLPLGIGHNRKAQIQVSRNQDWRITERAMHTIEKPVLIMWGDHDRYLDVRLLPRFQAKLAHAKTFVFRDCGHSPHEEYPDQANELIAAFVREDVLGTR
jgi:pimeloyl-ACP methyl ester carboxylesterase